MSRATDLLRIAAGYFDDGSDPFAHHHLVEHEITADECFQLANDLGTAAQVYAHLVDEMTSGGVKAQLAMQTVANALASEATRS